MMVEKIARALAEKQIRENRRWDSKPEQIEQMIANGVVDHAWQARADDALVALKAQREAIEDMKQPTIHYAVMKQMLDAAILEAKQRETMQ